MLEDISGSSPVLVREHRFTNAILETAKTRMMKHVPVGATLLDQWRATRYGAGPHFGMYELMRPR
jgi:hypothetical protein